MKRMKKYSLIILGVLLTFSPSTLAKMDSIPADIKEKADNYIIDAVGKQYFLENYKYDKDLSERKSRPNDIWVHYKYKPLEMIHVPEPFAKVRISREKLLEHYSYVVQKDGADIIEPVVSREAALDALKRKYPDVDFSDAHVRMWSPSWMHDFMKGWTWMITVSWKDKSTTECGYSQSYSVDAVTKEIGKRASRHYCR